MKLPQEEAEEEEICMSIELGVKAIEDKLHIDRGTFLELLRRSPFHGCHTGRPQFQVSRKRVLVNILKKEYVQNLVKIAKEI